MKFGLAGTILFLLAVVAYYTFRPQEQLSNDTSPFGETKSVREQISSRETRADDKNVNRSKGLSNTLQTAELEKPADDFFSDVVLDEVQRPILEEFISARPIGKYRVVVVNSDAFREFIRQDDADREFSMTLFDGQVIYPVTRGAEEFSEGWKSGQAMWIGHLRNDPDSQVTLQVTPGGSVSGLISSASTGLIRIQQVKGTSAHVIWSWKDDYTQQLD